jgi:hypothetical protein
VFPAKAGYANTIIVTLSDANSRPISNAQVQLTANMTVMDMGTTHANLSGQNSVYMTTLSKSNAFTMPGVWNVTVSILRSGQVTVQTTFKVTIS